MEEATLQFLKQLHSIAQESWIADRFRAELPQILSLTRGPYSPQSCPLTDAGDYCVRILQALSNFAKVVVNCNAVDHLNSRASALVDEADSATIGYLDDRRSALKIVADQLSSVADTCYEIWQETSTPPSEADAFSDGEDLFLQQSLVSQTLHPETLGETFKTPTSVPTTSTVYPPWPAPSDQEFGNEVTNAAPARGVSSVQDPLDEAFETPASMPDISTPYPSWPAPSDQEVGNNAINAAPDHGVSSVQSLSERLKMRGKGRYFCPYGMSCNKGGIINGQLKEFNRNSDFRSHMQKHQKQFKCDLPNCPNTTGFARIDQLERHKAKVKHLPLAVISHTPT